MLRSVDIKSTNAVGGRRDLSSFYRSASPPRDPGLFSPQVSCLDPTDPGPCLRSITAARIVNRELGKATQTTLAATRVGTGEVMMASEEISLYHGRVMVVGDVSSDAAITASVHACRGNNAIILVQG